MITSLDAFCINNGWSVTGGRRQLVSAETGPAVLVAEASGPAGRSYNLVFELFSPDDFTDFIEFFDTKRFTRAFDFTPPDTGVTQKYRFASFVPVTEGGITSSISAQLTLANGVS